ncbi:hypothetical protein KQH65_11455 [archaeon]|nr:hypothetical protein [archaeon]
MDTISEERQQKLKAIGLHYCLWYKNIVRYNKPACSKCVHSTYPKR